jgi:hypothetical protein
MLPLKPEQVTQRSEYPEMKTTNSEVVSKNINGRGPCKPKRISSTGLAAFILNSVNQTSRNPLVEEVQGKK